MNRTEVKSKLLDVINEMVVSDLEQDRDVPDAIAQEILQNYGFTVTQGFDIDSDDIDDFVKNLQKWIETKYLPKDDSNSHKEEYYFDLSWYDKYLEAEREYCEVLTKLSNVLDESAKFKETHSQYFKDECKARESKMEILSKKCQFLKLQFLSKLYEEENALKAHLILREKLREELLSLKKKYSELVEYNKSMNEIKTNKTFCELFKEYKELKKIEEMTEIIGSM